jgi:cytochrome c biogenesis protein ResB
MVRPAALGFVLTVSLVGCTSPRMKSAQSAERDAKFASEEQKLLACLDLRDHIVDLYADQYVEREGLAMTEPERTAFRAGWAEELAKRGTFERFEQSCFFGVTPRKYRCAMESPTTDGLIVCMKLSER